MRNPFAFLLRRNWLVANPNTVAAMDAYIQALLDVLRSNCRDYVVPVNADLEQVQGPEHLSAHPISDVSFGLHGLTFAADDYHAALREVTLPEGVEMRNLRYNRRTHSVSCVVDAGGMLRALRREMLEESESKN